MQTGFRWGCQVYTGAVEATLERHKPEVMNALLTLRRPPVRCEFDLAYRVMISAVSGYLDLYLFQVGALQRLGNKQRC